MDRKPLKDYLDAIEAAMRRGDATEHTHRPALKLLLEALAGPGVQAVNEPRRIACGAPDYVIARGTVPLGYIEPKDIGRRVSICPSAWASGACLAKQSPPRSWLAWSSSDSAVPCLRQTRSWQSGGLASWT